MVLLPSRHVVSSVFESDAPQEIAVKSLRDWLAAPNQPEAPMTIVDGLMLHLQSLNLVKLRTQSLHQWHASAYNSWERARAATDDLDALPLGPGSTACANKKPALRPKPDRWLFQRLQTLLQCHEALQLEREAPSPSHLSSPSLQRPRSNPPASALVLVLRIAEAPSTFVSNRHTQLRLWQGLILMFELTRSVPHPRHEMILWLPSIVTFRRQIPAPAPMKKRHVLKAEHS